MFGCSKFALAVFDFGDICDMDIGSSDARIEIEKKENQFFFVVGIELIFFPLARFFLL